MLSRYKIVRGRQAAHTKPTGKREDTRKHTRHPLRPTTAMVEALLADPSPDTWRQFRDAYLATLRERYATDPTPFDQLAERARKQDVYLGCNCPTRKQPDVNRCHTVLALQFMQRTYPDLEVVFPETSEGG
jgi:uncharacterized protein YeaO (DUF488 family)